jgi:hypothetical protein
MKNTGSIVIAKLRLFLKQDRDNAGCLTGDMSGCNGESFARNDVVRKSDLTKQARARDQSGWTDRPPNASGNFENISIPGAALPSGDDKQPQTVGYTVEQVKREQCSRQL